MEHVHHSITLYCTHRTSTHCTVGHVCPSPHHPPHHPPHHTQAYSLYRLGRHDEALSTIQPLTTDAENTEAAQQLYAQLLYRMGRGDEALAVYTSLHTAGQADAGELAANTVAAALLAGQPKKGLAVVGDKGWGGPRFETVFNGACCALDMGEVRQAEEQILLAQRLGMRIFVVYCVCVCVCVV